jgi:hypothetical protein
MPRHQNPQNPHLGRREGLSLWVRPQLPNSNIRRLPKCRPPPAVCTEAGEDDTTHASIARIADPTEPSDSVVEKADSPRSVKFPRVPTGTEIPGHPEVFADSRVVTPRGRSIGSGSGW